MSVLWAVHPTFYKALARLYPDWVCEHAQEVEPLGLTVDRTRCDREEDWLVRLERQLRELMGLD